MKENIEIELKDVKNVRVCEVDVTGLGKRQMAESGVSGAQSLGSAVIT
jgi:hypothetical protein